MKDDFENIISSNSTNEINSTLKWEQNFYWSKQISGYPIYNFIGLKGLCKGH